MVFTSIPLYLDPPLPNWQQQNNQLGDGNPQLQQQPQQLQEQRQSIQQQLQPPAPATSSIRPGSMADRARLAKIPQPEAALKCPRCDSTNTKFCYFNNYSLSQPRHFCKTCRRYWTRGGALRNVPVGGGCRRNKRSKGSSSTKSPASSSGERSNSTTPVEAGSAGQLPPQPQLHLPFMAGGLHHLSDHYSAAHHDHVGLSYGGIQAAGGGADNNMEFHMGSGPSTGSVGSIDQHWRLPPQTQQFPFLAGLEAPPSMYPFEGEAANSDQMNMGGRAPSSSGLITQMAPVKMEESHVGLNMNRNFLGLPGQDQYWAGGNAWSTTDLSGFSSSSTNHML